MGTKSVVALVVSLLIVLLLANPLIGIVLAAPDAIDRQVVASTDDCSRRLVTSWFVLNRDYINAGADWADYYQYGGGLRFTNITIPKGTTIVEAHLTLRCSWNRSGTVVNSRISAEDVDDAPTFANDKDIFDARWANRTTARVDWDAIPAWTLDTDYNSPDIKSVIQEIVDRGGWASGQAIVIFWDDFDDRSTHTDNQASRLGYSYDGSIEFAPKLHIEYTVTADPPTVTTSAATDVEESTATLNGEVIVVGDTNVTERGFVWDISTHGDPGDTVPALSDYASYWTEEGTFGTGTFNHGVASLTKGELYYVRACAENDLTPAKWGYGDEITFLTKPDEPTGLQDTAYTDNSIDLSWVKGARAQKTMVRYRTDQYPTSTSDGTQAYFDTGTSTTVETLSSGQIYYFRAWSYATEGGKEQYSDLTSDVTAYTNPGDPSTLDASNPSATTIDLSWAKGTGSDKTMIRRKEGSYPTSETDGQQAYFDTGATTQDSGLDPGTPYYYRAWAYDSDSSYYSDGYSQDSETTLVVSPTVTNNDGATNITDTTARLRGEITTTGGESPTLHIYWGDEDRGTEAGNWDHDENLEIKGEGVFFKDISDLIPETLYYYRCYAVNSVGGDWADSTAQFTTGAELRAPMNFTAVYVSDYQIDLSWDEGVGTVNTLIMANYGSYPIDRNNGYRAYYGPGTSCSDTLVDLQLKEVNVYYRAWSEDGSWSNDYAETNIGGVGMTLVAQAIFILGLSGLAMWRKNIILYAGSFLCLLLFGLNLCETSWMWGLGPLFLSAFMMYQSIRHLWRRRSY